jgi:hypothetical protein
MMFYPSPSKALLASAVFAQTFFLSTAGAGAINAPRDDASVRE